MRRILDYLSRHALAAAAFVCSILALAGSSYAAFTISGRQIVNHTIAPSKFNPKYINGSVRAWAAVGPTGVIYAGAGGPQVGAGVTLDPGFYHMRWRVNFPGRCATVASIDTHLPQTAGFASASTVGYPRNGNQGAQTDVFTYNQAGQLTALAFDIAVIC